MDASEGLCGCQAFLVHSDDSDKRNTADRGN